MFGFGDLHFFLRLERLGGSLANYASKQAKDGFLDWAGGKSSLAQRYTIRLSSYGFHGARRRYLTFSFLCFSGRLYLRNERSFHDVKPPFHSFLSMTASVSVYVGHDLMASFHSSFASFIPLIPFLRSSSFVKPCINMVTTQQQ